MLILSQADVDRLLPMSACIDVMAATLASLARGEAILPLRTVILIPESTDAFAVMPGFLGAPKTFGAKIITVYPGNHGTEFDSHQGAVLLFDPDNGSLAAVLDATAITTIRTAAVSAVATRLLARERASRLAIIGSGVQAHAHMESMCAVRPIKSLRVWSRNTEHARMLVSAARERFELDADVSPTAADAVRDAEIVCTATSARTPVLNGESHSPFNTGVRADVAVQTISASRTASAAVGETSASSSNRSRAALTDRKSTRLNSSHNVISRMPSSA